MIKDRECSTFLPVSQPVSLVQNLSGLLLCWPAAVISELA